MRAHAIDTRMRLKHRVCRKANRKGLRVAASQNNGSSPGGNSPTVKLLDNILGLLPNAQTPPKDEKQTPWWNIPPRQTAPPRQTYMSPGNEGRFLGADEMFNNNLRVGASAQPGQTAELPRVEPTLSYLLAATNMLVWGFGALVGASQGQYAADDYFLGMAAHSPAIAEGAMSGVFTSLLLYSQLPEALVGTACLLALGPKAEAVLGYTFFLTVYILGGLTSVEAELIFNFHTEAAAAAAGSATAIAATIAGFYLRNPNQKASNWVLPGLVLVTMGAIFLATTEGSFGTRDANCGPLISMAAGVWLGYILGPKLEVLTEVYVPDGSMVLPEEPQETTVVVDQATTLSKGLAAAAYSGGLILVFQLIANQL